MAIKLDQVFARLSLAVWVFDVDKARVVWANNAALKLWSADSLEELCVRDMKKDMSRAVERRLEQYIADLS